MVRFAPPIHLPRFGLGLALLLAAAIPACEPAAAQAPLCTTYAELKATLVERHHEQPIGGGMVTDKVTLQVFASADGRTWTLVSVGADGRACVAAFGKGWEPGVLPVAEGRS